MITKIPKQQSWSALRIRPFQISYMREGETRRNDYHRSDEIYECCKEILKTKKKGVYKRNKINKIIQKYNVGKRFIYQLLSIKKSNLI